MLIKRLAFVSKNHSFFLFGPRGTGKSTLLKELFSPQYTIILDLLNAETEKRLSLRPDELRAIVYAQPESITHIIIDEIQKIPKLLDVVHQLIEEKKKIFIMTGSSARKLRRGAANMLAGRAFFYELFPLSSFELKEKFDLTNALTYGTLPKLQEYQTHADKTAYLMSYTHTYLQEEVVAEQIIRKLDPFRRFLEVAAQCNGKIINISQIARDVGVANKAITEYFSILEDTLIGFFLQPFRHSFRKRLSLKPKFYYFDTGITRALSDMLTVPLLPQTSYFGEVFKHFVILECQRMAKYFNLYYRFSYLQTKDGAEIDLVVDRPGKPHLLIEIKSTDHVKEAQLSSLKNLAKDFGECEAVCFSRDIYARLLNDILVLPWREGIKRFFIPEGNDIV